MIDFYEVIKASEGIAVADEFAALWGRKISGGYSVETYMGALPAELENTVEGSLVSYKIWGNTGGVGVKKTNLADGEQLLRNASMSSTGEIVSTSSNFAFRLIPVVEGKTYSIVNIYGAEASKTANFYAFFEELPQIGSVSYNGQRYRFRTPSRTFIAPLSGYLATSDYYPMHNEQHSNLIPLEVYEGNASPYYLPMVSAITGLSEPLCAIGEYTDSLDLSTGILTRWIKKIELTGNGLYAKDSGGKYLYWMTENANHLIHTDCFCSHLESIKGYIHDEVACTTYMVDTVIYLNFGADVMNSQPSGNTAAGIKEYIAAQYAAGTPVTIWCVLEEPEVSTIPVPSGLTGTIEGYLIQDGTPTPEAPIYPSANDVIQTDTPIYIGRTTLVKDEYVDSESGKIYKWAAITGLSEPLCGIGTYVDSLDLSTGVLTRRIKKLVLTGEEELISAGKDTNRTVCSISLMDGRENSILCTHILAKRPYQPTEYDRIIFCPLEINKPLYISLSNRYLNDQTIASFKAYFASQYEAGTPVTVWYVLAEPETSTISVPSGLTGTIEGYLIQDGTPTPENPIYPSANGVKQTDGTYTIGNAYLTPTDPPEPLPQIPTFAGETTISYGNRGAQPEKVELKYKYRR